MTIYSRFIGIFVGLCLITILLTYRSFETQYIFYLSWSSGLMMMGLFACLTLYRGKLSLATTSSLMIVVPWIILGALIYFSAFDKMEHIKVLSISSFYMVTSVFIADMIIKSRMSMEKYSYQVLLVWIIVNSALFFLFLVGVYKPVKGDFSGVFHDRNVFSITTLLVMAFAATHLRVRASQVYKLTLYTSLLVCVGLILISKSITGLLGLLVLSFLYSLKLPLKHRYVLFITVLFALLLLLLTNNPISARLERFLIAISGDTDSLRISESAYLRVYIFKHGYELFTQHMWLGVGLNNAKEFIIWPNRGVGTFLHNNYLDILTSGGLPLFIVYYAPITYCLAWLIKTRKKVRNLCDKKAYDLCKLAIVFLIMKFVYDLTWTTYFEFFMVFTAMFSIYAVFHLKTLLRKSESRLQYRNS
ncbi:O-antigen ligase family protein [Vibrio breoganii]